MPDEQAVIVENLRAHRVGGFGRGRDLVVVSARIVDLGHDRTGQMLEPFEAVHLVVRLQDRKSTRLNSSHTVISYAVFCLKKKTPNERKQPWLTVMWANSGRTVTPIYSTSLSCI